MDESVPEYSDAPAMPFVCQLQSREEKLYRASTIYIYIYIYFNFPKNRNCDICLRTKITRAPCRKLTGTVVPRAEQFGDLITADQKVLSEECESRNNHRYAVVVQDLATQWIQAYPSKTKNFSGNTKELTEVLGAEQEAKSHLHWQFFRIWQILWRSSLELLYVDTTQIGNKWDRRKSSAQSERRAPLQKCCNQVWMKIGGQILWNAIPICETFKISCLMGKLHAKGGSECFLTDQWYRLDQWSPYLCEGHIEITSIWSKNLARYILRLCIVRGENLERKHWSQTLRNWKRWTHLKSMLKNPMQRKCQRVWVMKSSNSLITDGIVKLSGRDQVLRTSTLIRDSPDREEQGKLQGEPDGSSLVPFQDSSSDDGEARNVFRYITGNYIYRHHFEPRVKLYVPREALFPIPLKYIDVTRTTDTSLDFLARWWRSRTVRYVDRFHKILFIEWKTTRWVHMVGERLIRKQTTLRPATLWPEIWKDMTDAFKRKEQQKWAIEKPKLDNARRLRGVSRQKRNLLQLLTRTVPLSALRPVRLSRGDSASTTGTLDPDGEKKMPLKNKL